MGLSGADRIDATARGASEVSGALRGGQSDALRQGSVRGQWGSLVSGVRQEGQAADV